jgi:hypothetical protein
MGELSKSLIKVTITLLQGTLVRLGTWQQATMEIIEFFLALQVTVSNYCILQKSSRLNRDAKGVNCEAG